MDCKYSYFCLISIILKNLIIVDTIETTDLSEIQDYDSSKETKDENFRTPLMQGNKYII